MPEVPEPRFSVILLTYTRTDLALARMSEWGVHCADHDDAELLVLLNGSPPTARLLIADRHLRVSGRRFEFCEPNRGFVGGFNEAVRRTKAPWIVLLSDDVCIGGDFIPHLSALADSDFNGVVCKQMVGHPAGWNQFGARVIPYPFAYFLAMQRATWDRLGGFDERYLPYDYEDVDLAMTAASMGVPLEEIASLPVRHIGAQTIPYSPERMEITVRHRALFAEKWGLPNIPERP